MTKEAPILKDETEGDLAEEVFWGVGTNASPMVMRDEPVIKPVYDLEERTAKSGGAK